MCGMGPPFMTLVIFKVNQLGDNVVFLPVVQALSAVLKDWKIVVDKSTVPVGTADRVRATIAGELA